MKPEWLKKRLRPETLIQMQKQLRAKKLHTVCEEARCPNISECFAKKTATIMIMGDICTRSCKFCAVKSGRPRALDPDEPLHVADWAQELGFRHLVVTSVDRDDLPDLGAEHFAQTIKVLRFRMPKLVVEVLTPDFQGRTPCLELICRAEPHIFNHNLETVRRLTPQVRSAAKYDQSLKVLHWVKTNYAGLITKSGLMLGLGEQGGEIAGAMQDLRDAGCDMITLGQYLQPTMRHHPVVRYVEPREFEEWQRFGLKMGFRAVFSGPFVRSSYMADEQWSGEASRRP